MLYIAFSSTVISLYFVVDIFGTTLIDRKFVTQMLFYYENFSPSKIILIRIFTTGARMHGGNGWQCEVELDPAAVTKWESRMSLYQYIVQAVAT